MPLSLVHFTRYHIVQSRRLKTKLKDFMRQPNFSDKGSVLLTPLPILQVWEPWLLGEEAIDAANLADAWASID